MSQVDDVESLLRPFDEHNRRLAQRVRAPRRSNPEPAKKYHLVVVGAGTAGLVAAAGAAGLGARVALVERRLLGGDCLNFGCVPSKALLHGAREYDAFRRAARARNVSLDDDGGAAAFTQTMERLRKVRAELSEADSIERFEGLGVDVFIGEGRFRDGNSLEVAGKTLRFSRALIATGARPAVPEIDGLDRAGYFTNETVFELTQLPPRIAVLGGGPIGCELAQAFARFGSHVTIVQRDESILPHDDPEASAIAAQALQRDGVYLALSSEVERVEIEEGSRKLTFRGDRHSALFVDAIVVAVGRRPNVEHLGLDAAGVEFDGKRGVTFDDYFRTSNRSIYVAGDIASPAKFTHAADFMARGVVRNALFRGGAKFSALTIPHCTYTNPEVAQVGLTEVQAREQGIEVDVYRVELAKVDRSALEDETTGFVKAIVKRGTDRLVGVTAVGDFAGELICEATLAMTAKIGLKRIADVIHPYPTRADAFRKLGDAYNRSRLTGRAKTVLGWSLRLLHGIGPRK